MNLSSIKIGQQVVIHSVKLSTARPLPQSGTVEYIGFDASIKDRFGNETDMLILSQHGKNKIKKLKFWSHNIENIEAL